MSTHSEPIQRAAAAFIRDRHLLIAFAGGLLRNAHAAEDVLQEVWLRLAAEVEKGTPIENQTAWCRGVARNLIRRQWERRKEAKVVANSAMFEAFADRVEECFAQAESRDHWVAARLAALDECVAALPERSRRLLALKYAQRASLEDVAHQAGQSFEAVKKALVRIRAALAACVRHKLAQEGHTP